ncbi:unnamed protein product [Polarella glacialis]|uniref:Uncharacterized protein n=1 Tax=Polarella glacialis TaxID=89957 RepID=A0A813F4U9_POLGL|nr:unnamed protein product [Polarella glacialis]CAE8713319.1 unnamed protein product [Polarella glacialis]
MLTAIGSLMVLVMQYYPLGLALLGFTAALLYEKLTSMGMMFVSVATALGSGVASAAIDAQWNTVFFWSVCLTFVGLLVLGKQLGDYVRGVKPDEPLLPSWLIQQQHQLFAQLPQDSSPPPLPPPYEPPFESGYEEEGADSPTLQQNLFAFASGTAPLGPVSNTFAGQTGWSPGGLQAPPQQPVSWQSQPMWVQPGAGVQPGPPGSQPSGVAPFPGGTPFSPPPSGALAAAAAAGASPGFSQEELEKLASNERWTALPSSYKRAAGEIYQLMRSAGHATVREWFASAWGSAPKTQQRRDLYHSATLCDMRIDEYGLG